MVSDDFSIFIYLHFSIFTFFLFALEQTLKMNSLKAQEMSSRTIIGLLTLKSRPMPHLTGGCGWARNLPSKLSNPLDL